MHIGPKQKLLAVIATALSALVAVALMLNASHAREHRDLVRDFGDRAELAARLTGSALQASRQQNAEYARGVYSGSEAAVQRALKAGTELSAAVIGPRGQVLASQGAMRGFTHDYAVSAAARRGLQGYSDLSGGTKAPTMTSAVPFQAADGRRVWAFQVAAGQIGTFVGAYLTSALGVSRGRAYLIDGHGRVIATTGHEPAGTTIDPALRRQGPPAQRNGSLLASATITGAPWRVLFVAPAADVFAPTVAGERQSWRLFAGLVLLVTLLIALSANAVRQASRLAHERQHDTLTGLPTRALFAERTTELLDRLRRTSGSAAALFVDLDRFKPVNDLHGHAAGDQLLKQVADRLRDVVRGEDIVSRFGGDEFVVLCPTVPEPGVAQDVAERIQLALARPFALDDVEVTIGCSIGIALLHVPPGDVDVSALIQRADNAMYEAKRRQRGTIAVYADQKHVAA